MSETKGQAEITYIEIRRATSATVMAVGPITEPHQAGIILNSGQTDLIALARGMLLDPHWPWHAAMARGAQAAFPPQDKRTHPSLMGEPNRGNPPPAKS